MSPRESAWLDDLFLNTPIGTKAERICGSCGKPFWLAMTDRGFADRICQDCERVAEAKRRAGPVDSEELPL